MKRDQVVKYKYPHSVNLFRFTHRVLAHQKDNRINNKEIGEILNYKPSDCSHWKRGFKNVKTVTDLNKIADYLEVDNGIIYDLSSGQMGLEEAYFEFLETQGILELPEILADIPRRKLLSSNKKVMDFVQKLHEQANFTSPPLYIPEIMRFFPYITIAQTEMHDRLTRVHRVRSTRYKIHYKTGNLTPQTRLSMAKDLARIVLDVERIRYPELGEHSESTIEYEKLLFTSELLCPKSLLHKELPNVNPKLNITNEISKIFWVPRCLANYQLRGVLHEKFVLAKQPKPTAEPKKTDASITASGAESGVDS